MHFNCKQNRQALLKARLGNLCMVCMLFLAIGLSASAQSAAKNWVEPVSGIQVHPIFHASLEIRAAGKILLVDPSFDPKLLSEVQAPDLILLTDIHGDHMNPDILGQIMKKFGNKPIIAPKAVAEKLPTALRKNVQVLSNGQSMHWEGYQIKAVPMYNLADAPQMFHPKGRGNGYVLTVSGKRIYLSGDTQATPELRHLKNIDLAFVCMNLPYTMDVAEAASGILDFQPKVVIPYHYRGDKGLSDLKRFKQLVDSGHKETKVELLNFYPE